MKRFDKGYIYSSLLTDFFYSIVLVFIFLKDFFLNEESKPEDIEAVRRFREAGGIFGIVTGRTPSEMTFVLDRFEESSNTS